VRRKRKTQDEEYVHVAERLRPFVETHGDADAGKNGEPAPELVDELMERARTLLTYMPRNQQRRTIEDLISPYDRARGREAIDALIAADFVAEDAAGRLRRLR
jgi:polyhydroxyalkanoate synthesis regulator phasin